MPRWSSRLLAGIIAVAATLVVAVAALPAVTPLRTQLIVSGSMVPTIPVGALVVTAPLVGQAILGDIITFRNPFRDVTVVHRVVAVEVGADDTDYVTKGDANDTTDGWRIPVRAATGRVVATIPFVGYGIGTLQRPAARIGIGILVLAFIIPAFGLLGRRAPTPRPAPIPVIATVRVMARALAPATVRVDPHEGHDHLTAWLAQLRRAEARRGLGARSAA